MKFIADRDKFTEKMPTWHATITTTNTILIRVVITRITTAESATITQKKAASKEKQSRKQN